MNPEELVLCIKSTPTIFKPSYRILNPSPSELNWVARGICETDPSFKQVIPYVVLYDMYYDKYVSYRRKTGDNRLQGSLSIGIGGHINPDDDDKTFARIIENNIIRELTEELGFSRVNALELPDSMWDFFRGFIYDPSNDVGKVHTGLLFLFPVFKVPDDLLTFETTEHTFFLSTPTYLEEHYDELETWSQIFVNRFILRKDTKEFYSALEG